MADSNGESATGASRGAGKTFLSAGATMHHFSNSHTDGPMPDGVAGWRDGDAAEYNLRVGPNYKKLGKKAPSEDAMYCVQSVDIYHCHTWVESIAPIFESPVPQFKSPIEGIPTQVSTTILLPYIDTGMFGAVAEGPTVVIYVTAEMSAETIEALKDLDSAAPCYKLLVEWIRNFSVGKDIEMAGRLKVIGKVTNWDDLKLPGWLKGYNAKPVIIKKSGAQIVHPTGIHDQLVHIHKWSFLARKGLGTMKPAVKKMKFILGGVLEARGDEEMPERALFAVEGQHWPLFDHKHKIPEASLNWLWREAELANRVAAK